MPWTNTETANLRINLEAESEAQQMSCQSHQYVYTCMITDDWQGKKWRWSCGILKIIAISEERVYLSLSWVFKNKCSLLCVKREGHSTTRPTKIKFLQFFFNKYEKAKRYCSASWYPYVFPAVSFHYDSLDLSPSLCLCQSDNLLSYLTVEETLTYTAQLALRKHSADAVRKKVTFKSILSPLC